MDFRMSVPNGVLSEDIINAGLEMTTRANHALALRGALPDFGEALAHGVRWREEPWIGEEFALGTTVARRGWGDCDDLAPYLAGQLRASGLPDAKAFVYRSGPTRWHAVVDDGQGRVLDPSRWAGMGKRDRGRRLGRPTTPLTLSGASALCALPHHRERRWHARADLPVADGIHVCGWSRDGDLDAALRQAMAKYALATEGSWGIGEVGGAFGDLLEVVVPAVITAYGGSPQMAAASGPVAKKAGDWAQEKTEQAFSDDDQGGGEPVVTTVETTNKVNTSLPNQPPPTYSAADVAAGKVPGVKPTSSAAFGGGLGGNAMAEAMAKAAAAKGKQQEAKPKAKPSGPESYDIPGPGGVPRARVTRLPSGVVVVEF